jgi:hypothetical protein
MQLQAETADMAQNAVCDEADVLFNLVNNSSMNSFSISGGEWCIEDLQSQGGNTTITTLSLATQGLWDCDIWSL